MTLSNAQRKIAMHAADNLTKRQPSKTLVPPPIPPYFPPKGPQLFRLKINTQNNIQIITTLHLGARAQVLTGANREPGLDASLRGPRALTIAR